MVPSEPPSDAAAGESSSRKLSVLRPGVIGPAGSFERIDRRRLGRFLGTLFVLVTGVVAASMALGVDLVSLAPAYMFTPLLAGLAAIYPEEPSLSPIGLRRGRLQWAGIAALAVLPITVGTVAVSVAMPGIRLVSEPDLVADFGIPGGVVGLVAALFVAGLTVNAVLAAGEEVGWRGYLLWELAPLGFWRASAVIGTLWGVWHVPVILTGYNFPTFPVVGALLFIGFCIAASPLYTYVVVRGESILPAVLLHGVFNGVAGTLVLPYTTADSAVLAELFAHPGGVAGILVAGLLAAAIAVVGAPELSRTFATGDPADPD